MTEPNFGQAARTEGPDTAGAPRPADSYFGVASHLLTDAGFLATKEPPSGFGFSMLCGQALECLLKAYLSRNGKKTGLRHHEVQHNLTKLWTMASEDGLDLPSEPPGWVTKLSTLHDRPFYLRYAEGINGIVSPARQTVLAGLSDLLERVQRQLHS